MSFGNNGNSGNSGNNGNNSSEISYNEIYLFSYVNTTFDPLKIYNILSNNDVDKIDAKFIRQLCLNLNIEYKGSEKQKISNYEEFYSVLRKKNTHMVARPIGIDVENMKTNYNSILFPVNPITMVIPCRPETTITYSDQKLLFEYIGTACKEIFVCITEELENNTVETPVNIFKYYYPHLYTHKIISFRQYTDTRPQYISETQKKIQDYDERGNFETIDFIYKKS
jgi:hypothetical protein